jgi:hypothetical protein
MAMVAPVFGIHQDLKSQHYRRIEDNPTQGGTANAANTNGNANGANASGNAANGNPNANPHVNTNHQGGQFQPGSRLSNFANPISPGKYSMSSITGGGNKFNDNDFNNRGGGGGFGGGLFGGNRYGGGNFGGNSKKALGRKDTPTDNKSAIAAEAIRAATRTKLLLYPYTRQLGDNFLRLLKGAAKHIRECPCENGCPNCILDPRCDNNVGMVVRGSDAPGKDSGGHSHNGHSHSHAASAASSTSSSSSSNDAAGNQGENGDGGKRGNFGSGAASGMYYGVCKHECLVLLEKLGL